MTINHLDHDIFQLALDWHRQGRSLTIALVTRSWGSSPRQAGAAMLIAQTGEIAGSVSGGCVEQEVIEAAKDCLTNQQHKSLEFGVADETAWSNGLSCGGQITVLCLPVTEEYLGASLLREIADAIAQSADHMLAISETTGKACLVQDSTSEATHLFKLCPPRELIIVGAGHIAQILAPMAHSAQFAVTIIDPRAALLTKERFATGTLFCGWPSSFLTPDRLHKQTALVTLTHNPVIDDDALVIALASEAFHICALGSVRTHEKRLARLCQDHHKFSKADLQRIIGPAGLAIGAKTPAEIAVSILAQVIATFHNTANSA